MGFDQEFRSAYGHGAQYRAFGAADRARLAGTLPEYLLDLLDADGWASYRDGLLWTVDPGDFAPVVAAWPLPPDRAGVVPVMRTAFGVLYTLRSFTTARGAQALSVMEIDPHAAEYSVVGPGAEVFLTRTIAKDGYIEKVFDEPGVKRAIQDVGPLAWDQMYGYEPALALGGSGKPETVRRVNLFNHHVLLSQLTELKNRKY